jgi:hypothetical protein
MIQLAFYSRVCPLFVDVWTPLLPDPNLLFYFTKLLMKHFSNHLDTRQLPHKKLPLNLIRIFIDSKTLEAHII